MAYTPDASSCGGRATPGAAAAPPQAPLPRRSPLIKDALALRRYVDASGAERLEARPPSKHTHTLSCARTHTLARAFADTSRALLLPLPRAQQIAPVPDTLSFDKGFFLTFRAVQLLKGALPPSSLVVVGLAGPSGAGKTVFGEKLRELLPGSALLSMDMYNDGDRVVDANYDDPRLTDMDKLLENLADLRAGRATEAPVYDFKSSKRTGYRAVPVPSSRVVVIEGTFALSDALRSHVDLRVAITGGVHRDLIKRVLRDVTRSGQAPEEIIAQISETVYPMYKARCV
jgi:uridine kinase